MKYESYEDLKNHTLNSRDDVHFLVNGNTFKYRCHMTFLDSKDMGENDGIFKELGIDKESFARKHYLDDMGEGSFPATNDDSGKDITRITLALFKLCDNYNRSWKSRLVPP